MHDLFLVDRIITAAQKNTGLDILAWMVENGHRKAAVWLMGATLKTLVSSQGSEEKMYSKHPSNIAWAEDLFESIKDSGDRTRSLWSEHQPYSAKDAFDLHAAFDPEQRHDAHANIRDRMLNHIWATLGRLVLRSADATPEQANHTMSAVQLILGLIHNLGIMPDGIYDTKHYPHSLHVPRPPVLHLVSSRILTSLSDAAWREQQDDAIAQATDMGMSLKEISESVPGGRFRLKVRPLGPEIWLELILWCCIENDHIRAALHILGSLRDRTDRPWFAIRWCSTEAPQTSNVSIDWKRLQHRHGRTVGLIEGYSREKPFVDVPERTISAEVILALLDALLSNLHLGRQPRTTTHRFEFTQSDMDRLYYVVSFLEPHDIPAQYWDYLESRPIQAGAFHMQRTPALLQSWSSTMDRMRCLESAAAPVTTKPDLHFGSIASSTLLHTATQHQALDGLLQLGDVHRALAQFNAIQENVDEHKLKSMTDFLQMQPVSEKGFFSSRLFRHRLEYADSHGQLPYYKLAGFLNLISDTGLTGLGQWLLYSDDMDGSLIPESAYGLPGMATALCRFASVSLDDNLLSKVLAQVSSSGRKPTVRFLRRLFDGDVQRYDFPNARNQLMKLRRAQGGGCGLTNIAHLAGMILQLEFGRIGMPEDRSLKLGQATILMKEIWHGYYFSRRGDFTKAQRKLFNRQLGHILKVFYTSGSTTLKALAETYAMRYGAGNLATLPANIFNILLSATVSIRGSVAGQWLWSTYCQDLRMLEHAPDAEDDFIDPPDHADSAVDISFAGIDAEGEVTKPSMHTDATSYVNIHSLILPPTWAANRPLHNADIATLGSPKHSQTTRTYDPESGYVDPFFPPDLEEIRSPGSSPSRPQGLYESDLSVKSDTADSQDDARLSPAPITIPNLQTLRIVVRSAVAEKAEAMEANDIEGIETADSVLKWAISEFVKFGTLSKDIIEQEIQQPVSSLDEEVGENIARPAAMDDLIRFPTTELEPMKKPAPARVSALWVPKKSQNFFGVTDGPKTRSAMSRVRRSVSARA